MRSRTRDLWEVNKYLWLCLVFAGIFIPLAQARGWLPVPLASAYGLYLLAVANGAARTYVGWRTGGQTEPLSWVFTVVDAALISAAVSMTRGLRSELWLLYYVLLVSESLFASSGQAGLLLLCVAAGYVLGTWSDRASPDWGATIAIRVGFLALGMAFVRRLAGDRERRTLELATLREQVAASDERTRIAREVHDSLGHALVASILRLELCLRLLRREPGEAEQILREEVPALRTAWSEGRDLAFHLRPWETDGAGLALTLRRNVGRFAERTGLSVELACDEAIRLAPEAEMAVTRIVQEALTNVARHAGAARVHIDVERGPAGVRCIVQDDGAGFDPAAREGSFGLNAMRERADAIGGSFRLVSRLGAGTTVEVGVPQGLVTG